MEVNGRGKKKNNMVDVKNKKHHNHVYVCLFIWC